MLPKMASCSTLPSGRPSAHPSAHRIARGSARSLQSITVANNRWRIERPQETFRSKGAAVSRGTITRYNSATLRPASRRHPAGVLCQNQTRVQSEPWSFGKLWRPLPSLHTAARRGNTRRVKELLESGVPVDARDQYGSTPLMHAAEKKRVATVDALLQAGACVDSTNNWGFTPFLYAAKGGDTLGSRRVLRLLLPAASKEGSPTAGPASGPAWMRLASSAETAAGLDRKPEEGTDVDLWLEEVTAWLGTKAEDAQETWRVMLDSTDEVTTGGHVIAGKTAEIMGVLDGQRYKVESLFYRPEGELTEGEPRVYVQSELDSPPTEAPEGSPTWELWAELSSKTWMPWGSTEVGFEMFRLRSVGAELKGSLAVAFTISLFWLVVAPAVVSFRFAYVPSESMAPTLHAGDLLLVDRNPGQLTPGDIVLFKPPPLLVQYAEQNGDRLTPRDRFVKRVIGAPGDIVSTDAKGQVFIDGALRGGLSSTGSCATCRPPTYTIDPLRVPEGQLLVLGDNRGGSADSHVWGFLPREQVEGRVFWRLLPWTHFEKLGRDVTVTDGGPAGVPSAAAQNQPFTSS